MPRSRLVPSVLARSFALLRAHPVIMLALGVAIVASISAMCTGLGLLVAPWFVCELCGAQLAACGRAVVPRGRAWVSASLVVLVMLVIAGATGWLAALGFGPDVATADASEAPLPWPDTLRVAGLTFGVALLPMVFLAPFVHAPLILLDRGGRLGGALMESAKLVRETGQARHFAIATTAQVCALLPIVLASMFVARTWERAATPLGMLVALPVTPIFIVLGLGLVTATYVEVVPALGDARRAQRLHALPTPHVVALSVILGAPLLGLLLLAASALWPAPPIRGPVPDPGEEVGTLSSAEGELLIPGTALVVRRDGDELSFAAGRDAPDTIPHAWREPLTGVEVRRAGDSFTIEARTASEAFHVRVDRAGTRVDDSVRASLLAHFSGWVLWAFVVSAAIVALFSIRAFAPLGAARARAALRAGTRTVDESARRQSYRVALALLPFALTSFASGLLAFLRV